MPHFPLGIALPLKPMTDLCTACNAELTAYQVLVCRSTLCPVCESVEEGWPDGDEDVTVPELGDEGCADE